MSKTKVFMSDFETTVFEGQTSTEVWAAAIVELNTEKVLVFHSLPDWFDYILMIAEEYNVVTYFHNLKFDGEFILTYLLKSKEFKVAYQNGPNGIGDGDFVKRKEMKSGTFSYSISDRGQWYSITIKLGYHFIDIRDSLKLLPLTVEKIGKSFGTKHKKLTMEYSGKRYAGCEITDEEKEYIKNDVLVVKEALEIMFEQGHNKTTIGSCCLAEYKKTCYFDAKYWDEYFPDLYAQEFPKDADGNFEYDFGAYNIGEYIRQSYHGGWCYLVEGKERRLFHDGITADVNSLYPSMMHSESGNIYPVGSPTFWIGNYIPQQATDPDSYYFIRIKTEFKIKPGYLPCIQIKNNFCYPGTEWLTTSDIKDADGNYHNTVEDPDGTVHRTYVYLTLTMTDYALIKEHYELYNEEILDGCYFKARRGIFDFYIDKYKKIKIESTGARREVAKLFLNNLYGKMAANTDSSFKYAYIGDDDSIHFYQIPQYKKKPGYIPIGSAITSYARNFTIRAAQKNYHGVGKPGFIYADTDSIHCDLSPEQLKDIKVDPVNFCCWKLESSWDTALFVRQKTYIEHIVAENLEPIKHPYYSVKCAGMPQRCKELFILTTIPETRERLMKDNDFVIDVVDRYGEFGLYFLLNNSHELTDFDVGLVIPTGKLMPKHIPGGVLLKDSPYVMRRKILL